MGGMGNMLGKWESRLREEERRGAAFRALARRALIGTRDGSIYRLEAELQIDRKDRGMAFAMIENRTSFLEAQLQRISEAVDALQLQAGSSESFQEIKDLAVEALETRSEDATELAEKVLKINQPIYICWDCKTAEHGDPGSYGGNHLRHGLPGPDCPICHESMEQAHAG